MFFSYMKELTQTDYTNYLDLKANQGARANTIKISVSELKERLRVTLDNIIWSSNGFYYGENDKLSKHPYYSAGLYYIQEPSAQLSAEMLNVQEGDYVLDICAAPGGKSTQLGAKLKNTGLLWANDISASRCNALVNNIERFGITNSIVTAELPENLLKKLPLFFDKILVDAPCSGEGMFRKFPKDIKKWSYENANEYASRQLKLLNTSSQMLKFGGYMLYSTCTFNTIENENVISNFLKENNDFELVDIHKDGIISKGFEIDGNKETTKCGRIFPHLQKGEGHFAALLKKSSNGTNHVYQAQSSPTTESQLEKYRIFEADNLNISINGNFKLSGSNIYLLPNNAPSLDKLRVMRSGLFMGELKKHAFIPSQAFAMSLKCEEFKRTISLSPDDTNITRYLKGETIFLNGEDGYNLICTDEFPLGFGKLKQGQLKNKYGWVWT